MTLCWKFILLPILWSFLSSEVTSYHPGSARIIKGRETSIKEFPWIVSLQATNNSIYHFCGGSIYSKNYVITAAHCIFNGFEVHEPSFHVRAGSTRYNSGGTLHRVIKIIKHHGFNLTGFQHDIAVLKVRPDFKFSSNVRPINLDNEKPLPLDTEVDVVGWGRVQANVYFKPVILQRVEVLVSDPRLCEKHVPRESVARQICTRSRGGKREGTCKGDSGGSLTYNGTLYGITSWLIECGHQTYPSGFTKVSAYKDWIRKITTEDCDTSQQNTTSEVKKYKVDFLNIDLIIMYVALCISCTINIFAFIFIVSKFCCTKKKLVH